MLPLTRRATAQDLPQIMTIIHEAQNNLKADGVPQWQDGYPDEALIKTDIASGEAFVLANDIAVVGYAVIRQTPEPNYTTPLEGKWSDDVTPYVSLHRIAISSAFRGQHLGQLFMSNLFTWTNELGFQAVRIDTHPLNQRMQRLIQQAGFTFNCTVCMDGNINDIRWAYSLMLPVAE
ncbi:GNAT family N-acetyltransferase [Weissella viridescens]|uniref:GNAT family N-acetyltransferase n=1 Tax=Weissella viridescens TaxID=1629 RepID=A0A3P2RD03_WEIVI|nr:GNAT family N-acetyltransferase [Weissella viridescens]RRG18537.1 GNAT family N-acetyltransferase [Weissella viridescens]